MCPKDVVGISFMFLIVTDLQNLRATVDRVGPQPSLGNEIWVCETESFIQNIINKELVLGLDPTVPYTIIDGNHRHTLFTDIGMTEWPCLVLTEMYSTSFLPLLTHFSPKEQYLQDVLIQYRNYLNDDGTSKATELEWLFRFIAKIEALGENFKVDAVWQSFLCRKDLSLPKAKKIVTVAHHLRRCKKTLDYLKELQLNSIETISITLDSINIAPFRELPDDYALKVITSLQNRTLSKKREAIEQFIILLKARQTYLNTHVCVPIGPLLTFQPDCDVDAVHRGEFDSAIINNRRKESGDVNESSVGGGDDGDGDDEPKERRYMSLTPNPNHFCHSLFPVYHLPKKGNALKGPNKR